MRSYSLDALSSRGTIADLCVSCGSYGSYGSLTFFSVDPDFQFRSMMPASPSTPSFATSFATTSIARGPF